eukprot:TRINITY_DN288_c0_g1_i1.p2 TRINITY_DN288_c0_g1~~TRINITY_DN288_c0_g1_i1.p2  ORF type:complete len:313 (-),score=131.87 TRINITY_DN288_c0_g1_i1:229-1047(-)
MANLKELKIRMASVESIKKITASMKMVAAARMKSAENKMRRVRPFARVGKSVMDSAPPLGDKGSEVVVLLTSDRGLCGSINSSLARTVRDHIKSSKNDIKLIVLGDKGKAATQREFGHKYVLSATDLGKKELNFVDLETIVEEMMETDYDQAVFYSNKFVSVLAFETLINRLRNLNFVRNELDVAAYEFEDEKPEALKNFYEYYVSTLLYSALTENAAAELAARMTSMDNATRNAGDMLDTLTLSYNRQRQAGITTELTEIIAGSESLQDAD